MKLDDIILMDDGTKLTKIQAIEVSNGYAVYGYLNLAYSKPIRFIYWTDEDKALIPNWWELFPEVDIEFPTESYFAVCELYRKLIKERLNKILK